MFEKCLRHPNGGLRPRAPPAQIGYWKPLLWEFCQWTGGYTRHPHRLRHKPTVGQTAIMQNSPSPRRSSVTTSPRPRVSPGRAPRASTAPAGQTPRSLRLARSQVHQATIETAPGQPGFSPEVSPVAALPFTDSLPRLLSMRSCDIDEHRTTHSAPPDRCLLLSAWMQLIDQSGFSWILEA